MLQCSTLENNPGMCLVTVNSIISELDVNIIIMYSEFIIILSLRHPAAWQFSRSTYTITDITIK
jgi:hypothetical protein